RRSRSQHPTLDRPRSGASKMPPDRFSTAMRPLAPIPRRLILSAAFLVGLAVTLAPRMPAVHAQETKSPPAASVKAPPPAKPGSDARTSEPKVTVEIKDTDDEADEKEGGTSATPRKGSRGQNIQIDGKGRVRVNGLGVDRTYDSFDQMVQDQ